jgi:DNA-binding NarL/FixJ family response regulator
MHIRPHPRHGEYAKSAKKNPRGGYRIGQESILLADDHEVVRDGLRVVLDSAPDLEVVAEAGDGAEAVLRVLILSMHENEQHFFEALTAGASG